MGCIHEILDLVKILRVVKSKALENGWTGLS